MVDIAKRTAHQREFELAAEAASEGVRDRVYQVSSNRGNARHKMRYVEASAPAAGECRLCVGNLSPKNS